MTILIQEYPKDKYGRELPYVAKGRLFIPGGMDSASEFHCWKDGRFGLRDILRYVGANEKLWRESTDKGQDFAECRHCIYSEHVSNSTIKCLAEKRAGKIPACSTVCRPIQLGNVLFRKEPSKEETPATQSDSFDFDDSFDFEAF